MGRIWSFTAPTESLIFGPELVNTFLGTSTIKDEESATSLRYASRRNNMNSKEARERLETLNPEEREAVNGIIHTLQQIFDVFESEVIDWETFYDRYNTACTELGYRAADGSAPDNFIDFASSVISLSLVYGYSEFRKSQPTMIDFELAKRIIFAHAREKIRDRSSLITSTMNAGSKRGYQ